MWPGVLGFVSGLDNLIGKMGGHWSPRIELNSKYCLCFCHDFLFVSSPIRGFSWSVYSLTQPTPQSVFALPRSHSHSLAYTHTHTGKAQCLFYVLQMKRISKCMARDTRGGAKKKNPLQFQRHQHFFANLQLVLRASVN